MNSVPVFRFSKLSFGVARTSIRHGHTRSRRRTPQHELTNFEPGHGEQIWVWSHLTSNQVIYSHTKQLEVRFLKSCCRPMAHQWGRQMLRSHLDV